MSGAPIGWGAAAQMQCGATGHEPREDGRCRWCSARVGPPCPACRQPVDGKPPGTKPHPDAVPEHQDCLFPNRGNRWTIPAVKLTDTEERDRAIGVDLGRPASRAEPSSKTGQLPDREALDKEVQLLRAALRDASEALHRDRSGLATALNKIVDEVGGRAWIAEGRGPYEWDDDRYKAEAGEALRAVGALARDALRASGTLVHPVVRAIDRLLPGAADDGAGLFAAGAASRDAEVEALRAEKKRLGALFQQTHGCHHSWVEEGVRLRADVERLARELDSALNVGADLVMDRADLCDTLKQVRVGLDRVTAERDTSQKLLRDLRDRAHGAGAGCTSSCKTAHGRPGATCDCGWAELLARLEAVQPAEGT